MDRQEAAYRASVELGTRYSAADVTPRRQARDAVGHAAARERFTNAADTDPAVAANRAWAARIVGPDSGFVPTQSPEVTSTDQVDDVVARAGRATAAWAQVAPRTAPVRCAPWPPGSRRPAPTS